MKKISFLTIVFLISINVIFAQKDNWSGEFKLGGSYYKGNVNKTDLRSIGEVSHKDSTFEFTTSYKTVYGINNNIENNREFSSMAKFDWRPYSIVSPFIAFSSYNNIYKGYDLRLTGIAGSKFAFSRPNYSYSLSVAGLYSIEKYTPPKDITELQKDDTEKVRLSLRPKIKQKLSANTYFSHYTFFQPNVNDFSDYMIESRTSISNKLTSVLFLDISLEYEYVSRPPSVDIKNEDVAFIISLIVKL